MVERAVREGVAASQGRVVVDNLEEGAAWGGVAAPSVGGYGELIRQRSAAGGPPLFEHPAYGEGLETAPDGSPGGVSWPTISAERDAHRSGAKSGPADTPFVRLIGQYRDSFLLLEDDHGLVIVDKHVAHERVLYDRILRRLAGEETPSQGLLAPRVLEVGEARAAAFESVAELLRRVGIEAEIFGHGTIRLSSVPPELEAEEVDRVVEEILDRATALDGVPERATDELEEEIAASLSCRAAIKINHRL